MNYLRQKRAYCGGREGGQELGGGGMIVDVNGERDGDKSLLDPGLPI